MKDQIRVLFCIFCFLTGIHVSYSQYDTSPNPLTRADAGINFSYGIPVGSFRDQLGDPEFSPGFSVYGMYRLAEESPWLLGMDLGTVRYSKERDDMWIDGEQFPVKTIFHLTPLNFTATYSPRREGFQPFISVHAGVMVLYAATKSNKNFFELLFNDFENELIYDKHKVTPDLGFAPGFIWGGRSFSFRASCKFIFGGKVRHVDPETIDVSNIDFIEYSFRTTYPRVIIPEVGFSFQF